MTILFIVLGYLFIAAIVGCDVRRVLKRCRLEVRYSFGKRTLYLRERSTGRLIGCGNNPFTLILQGL